MSSILETTLARDNIRNTLSDLLQHDGSLRTLRLCSRILKTLVDIDNGKPFQALILHAPLRKSQRIGDLENIAPYCQRLTVKVGYPYEEATHDHEGETGRRRKTLHPLNIPFLKKIWDLRQVTDFDNRASLASTVHTPSTLSLVPLPLGPVKRSKDTHPEALALDLELWAHVLGLFGSSLMHLTLRVNSSAPWPGRTIMEESLLTLRLALERSAPKLPNLSSLKLGPVHAMGILHLRWDAFGSWQSHPSARPWHNITTLSIELHNPIGQLTERQEDMFFKTLHAYLRSFASRLRVLKFTWLGNAGPSPFNLTGQEIRWDLLEEVELANLAASKDAVEEVLRACAPFVKVVKLEETNLEEKDRQSEQGSRTGVSHAQRQSRATSSLYSRSVGGRSLARMSRASGEIPIMLDPDLSAARSNDRDFRLPATTYTSARAWWRKSRMPTS